MKKITIMDYLPEAIREEASHQIKNTGSASIRCHNNNKITINRFKEIDSLIDEEIQDLKNLIEKKGDTIVTDYHKSGAVTRQSKRVGDARIDFIKRIQKSLNDNRLSVEEANYATKQFGLKTKKLFWK